MRQMKTVLLFVTTSLLVIPNLMPARGQTSPLAAYIDIALDQNLALQQQQIDLEQNLMALETAKGMFLPSLQLDARYSRAGGGRTISFPVGDLLNPVYATLNDLTAQQAFPQIQNEEINFLRPREQETRIRILQPLYQPALMHNLRLERGLLEAKKAEVEVFRSTLIRDVRVAYYTYQKAADAVQVYTAALELVRENERVNKRLFENDKITEDGVFRAQTEVLAVLQELAEAEKERGLARSYFNFLLNRDLDEPIEEAEWPLLTSQETGAQLLPASLLLDEYASFYPEALEQRKEIRQLEASIQAAKHAQAIARSALLPGISLALDVGLQGTRYGIGEDQSFYMASVVLSWNLFSGFQNRNQVKQARLASDRLEIQKMQVERQIELQVQEAYDQLGVARKSAATASERLLAAAEGFRRIQRRFEEGMVNQVAYLDARSALTQAELNMRITQQDIMIRVAELQFALAHPD